MPEAKPVHTPASIEGATDMRIATAPVNWNNFDLPEWRPTIPFPEILDLMCEAGYRSTEYDRSFGTDPELLLAAAHQRDLRYIGTYRWFDFLDEHAFQAGLEQLDTDIPLLARIDCRQLIVSDRLRSHRVARAGAIPVDGSTSLVGAEYAALASRVRRVAERASAAGISVHYHNHVGTYIETPWELANFCCELDRRLVNLCFDTGHYAYGGGDAAAFVREHIADIGLLHLKDVDANVRDSARTQNWNFLDALRHYVFCPLGEGAADIRAIAETLQTSRFPHHVVIEQDTCSGDPTATARQNRQYLLSLSNTLLD